MPYPDDFSSRAYADRFERADSRQSAENERIGVAAADALNGAINAILQMETAPGIKTSTLIDEAVAWLDEHQSALRCTAKSEAQDL